MTVQGLSLKCLRVSRKLEPAGMEMRLLEKGCKMRREVSVADL